MPSETAYDTALAASKATARSATSSPSSGSTGTKLIDPVQHTETGDEHAQIGATDHCNTTSHDADDGTDEAIFDRFLRAGSTRSPSPAFTETKLRSTPPAETGHSEHADKVRPFNSPNFSGAEKVQANVEKPSQVEGHPKSVVAYTTPQCRMTGEELGSLRKPGDSVTTKEGNIVQLVEDSERRLLFLSQISSTTLPTSYQQGQPNSSNSVRSSSQSQKKRHKRVSMLASIDSSNIIDMTDAEEEEGSRLGTPPTSSMPPSSYSLRNRRAPQGKLIYDAKYHPMDDSIRPSQAAKRRFAHGELELSSDEEDETFSVHSESEGDDDEQETRKLIKKFGSSKSKKRSRSWLESAQPTRRSSRRASSQKVSYNMNVHPQDRYLEISSSDDEDSDTSSHRAKRAKTSHSSRSDAVRTPNDQKTATITVIADSEADDEEDEEDGDEAEHEGEEITADNKDDVQSDDDTTHIDNPRQPTTASSSSPDVTTPPSFGIRRASEIGVHLLNHGDRYASKYRDSWPIKQGLPFEIHSERLEDQLAAEAEAASPLEYDEDDKENDMLGNRFGPTPDAIEGMSVVPLSQYRSIRAENDGFIYPAASAAFYDGVQGSLSPYNLGGHDGSDDQDILMRKARSDLEDVREHRKENTLGVTAGAPGPIDDATQEDETRTFTPINSKP